MINNLGSNLKNDKKITWFKPQLGNAEKEAVLKVLESNYINEGQVVCEFEQRIADYIGARFCIAVTSGTAAIALSLLGLGIKPGDEVLVPDFTFIATANAVRLAGANVKLIDVIPQRFTIDVNKIPDAITERTKAIIAVDVNGRGADYKELKRICKRYNLVLICDSAEALGSKYEGQYLGTYGDAGCFSFSANKTITSGQGGMIATNNESLFYRVRELKDQGRRFGGTGGDDLHPVLGFNFKYTNLQAAIALAQFEKIGSRLAHFYQRDTWYMECLSNCPRVTLPLLQNKIGEICQWTDMLCANRKIIESNLTKHNIDFRSFWLPLHRQKHYLLPDDEFENSIRISETGLWLPSSFEINQSDIKIISKCIQDVVYDTELI